MQLTDPTLNLPFLIIARASLGPVPAVPLAVFLFPIAPQEVDVQFPTRAAVHQTIGSNWVDRFSGPNSTLAKVTLRGTFGYRPKFGGLGATVHGSLHLRAFELMLESFNALNRAIQNGINAQTDYVDTGRLHYWNVLIEHLEYRQTNRDPLLFTYTLRMTRLEDHLNPVSLIEPGLPAPISGTNLAALF